MAGILLARSLLLWFGVVGGSPLTPKPKTVSGYDPRFPEEIPGLFQGDIEMKGNPFSRSVVGDLNKRWPIRKIPVHIHTYFNEHDKNIIFEALREIEESARVDGKDCITFYNQTEEEIYVYFSTGTGCRSNIGYKGERQGVKLGKGCRHKGIIMHEVLHTLGFYHEQSRPDRDKYVKVMSKNVNPKDRGNFMKLLPPMINTQGLPYDYNSLMHYDRYYFAIDRSKPTLVPLKKNVDIGQRIGMSQLDIVQLQRFYGCPERKLVTIPPKTVSVNCTFDADYCGWTHVFVEPPMKKNTWIRWSGETNPDRETGPKTDHTFGTFEGHYLYTEASDRHLAVAKIQTPELTAGDHCLTFWYHMFGNDMGSLRVKLLDGKRTKNLMTISGDQGNKWKQMRIFLNAPPKSMIEFESIIGFSHRSDIGIDDVFILDGRC